MAAINLNKEQFQQMAEGGKPILVDFWAPWCGPCRMQGPAVEKLAVAGYNVGKVNIDEQPELAEKFSIMQAPTLVIVRDGIVQKFANASNIRKFVEQEPAETAKA